MSWDRSARTHSRPDGTRTTTRRGSTRNIEDYVDFAALTRCRSSRWPRATARLTEPWARHGTAGRAAFADKVATQIRQADPTGGPAFMTAVPWTDGGHGTW